MLPEERFALRKSDGMGKRFSNFVQSHARRRDQRKHDMTDRLANDPQVMREQQVIAGMDRTRKSVLNGHDAISRFASAHRIEYVFESGPRQQLRCRRKQVNGGVFAVGSQRSLIGGIVDGGHLLHDTALRLVAYHTWRAVSSRGSLFDTVSFSMGECAG